MKNYYALTSIALVLAPEAQAGRADAAVQAGAAMDAPLFFDI